MLQFIGGLRSFSVRGRKSTEDDHRSGRPVDVCADENVRHVNDMIRTA